MSDDIQSLLGVSDDARPILPHLGSDFYIWLWWHAEKDSNEYYFKNKDPKTDDQVIGLWIDTRLGFRSKAEAQLNAVFTGDNPSERPETRTALRSGQALEELRIGLRIEDSREYLVTLKGPAITLNQVRLSGVSENSQLETVVVDRMLMLRELEDTLARLFQDFLQQRTSGWKKDTYPQIKQWAQEER
jgi:hypothetical protein